MNRITDMATDYSKESFLKFLDYLVDRGLIKYQTVRGWRSAASKLLNDLSDAEEADVRTIDLELAVHKAANREPGLISPQSLKTYQQRIAIAIQEFVAWRSNPAGYKPRSSNGQTGTNKSVERLVVQERSISEKHERENLILHSGLTLSYPLRSDFLAQVVIPRDLNVVEAKRLGAFLLTIAVDYQPE
uniref:hypothetical protein n=1 Tax=Trichocoleus desertorum TaxID=1481672 RepID=UPI0025B5A341|nr:hypothetical protein [Trichocoleus desertorum]